jgi:hypothetical protein
MWVRLNLSASFVTLYIGLSVGFQDESLLCVRPQCELDKEAERYGDESTAETAVPGREGRKKNVLLDAIGVGD